jgi:hypothetical protein
MAAVALGTMAARPRHLCPRDVSAGPADGDLRVAIKRRPGREATTDSSIYGGAGRERHGRCAEVRRSGRTDRRAQELGRAERGGARRPDGRGDPLRAAGIGAARARQPEDELAARRRGRVEPSSTARHSGPPSATEWMTGTPPPAPRPSAHAGRPQPEAPDRTLATARSFLDDIHRNVPARPNAAGELVLVRRSQYRRRWTVADQPATPTW